MDSKLKADTIAFVKEFWDIFRADGVQIPVQGYEMVINTGDCGATTTLRTPRDSHYAENDRQSCQAQSYQAGHSLSMGIWNNTSPEASSGGRHRY
eukprot:scaffold404103_cov28-Attheya_sp.AAC.1